MKIVGFSNQKGGCGKTTTLMNLAACFTKIGYRVLVIDGDPQVSATCWSLAKGQASLPFDVWAARVINYRLARLAAQDADFDLVLVDLPPGMVDAAPGDNVFAFARSVIRGADLLVVPLMPSSLDFAAARTFVRYLSVERGAESKVGVLLNSVQRTRLSSDAPAFAAEIFAPIGGVVFKSSISRRVCITEVVGLGCTVFDLPCARPAALEYTNLAKEILCLLAPAPSQPSTSPISTSPSAEAASSPSLP